MTVELKDIDTVTIPIPQPFQRNYGVHATTNHLAVRLMQRYSREQFAVIEKAASRLGVTLSAFIKESAYNMAKAITLKIEDKEKENAKHDLRSG